MMLSRQNLFAALRKCCNSGMLYKDKPSFRMMNSESDAKINIERTLNQVTLLGRVGGDPQLRGRDNHQVAIFSLATHVNFINQDGNMNQKTDWHRICVFKPSLRETALNYVKKGQRIYIVGKIMYGEIKEGDSSRSTMAVVAEDIIFFQPKS